MIRAYPLVVSKDDALGGFEWTKRSLPLSVIGKGQSNAAGKMSRLVHMIRLEAGNELKEYRQSTKGYNSDGGIESLLATNAFVTDETLQEIQAFLLAMRNGDVPADDPRRRSMKLFPLVLETQGVKHQLGNAFRESLEQREE